MATRKYEQRIRAQAAEQTRRDVLDAVYRRLREAPSEKVSLDQVARIAGVARSTVYQIFGSRAGLFDAVRADLMQRGGFERVMRAAAHPDAREGLRGVIRNVVRMYAANRDVLRALSSMDSLDKDAVSGTTGWAEEGRAVGMATLARQLDEQHHLRPDVDVETATHVLWMLASFDTFDVLYTGRNLPADAVADILIATAERSLCS